MASIFGGGGGFDFRPRRWLRFRRRWWLRFQAEVVASISAGGGGFNIQQRLVVVVGNNGGGGYHTRHPPGTTAGVRHFLHRRPPSLSPLPLVDDAEAHPFKFQAISSETDPKLSNSSKTRNSLLPKRFIASTKSYRLATVSALEQWKNNTVIESQLCCGEIEKRNNGLKEWNYLKDEELVIGFSMSTSKSSQPSRVGGPGGNEEIKGLIEKNWETSRYLKKSPAAAQKFDTALDECNLKDKRQVAMDVPNRWNSTFELLETALPLREAFCRLERIDKHYLFNPSESKWEMAASIHKHMAGPMKIKFDKYWDKCCLVLAVAVVFDPRYKMSLVKFYYTRIYGSSADQYITRVRDTLKDLFFTYGGSRVSSAGDTTNASSSIIN
ncbi:hypothetical protein BUALT_Bualt04G0007900 [Buddleja alternifolia]|uniref:hAT-like transposase RNase-H fold domain-containing protein n=1 Tax=Buddleja alternifolia TaxID=168488 RepID=A0AAV6XLL3_9LAMI|nr:hypothetical protein BUALT_Bualt04G0007900 [Buddleja alternifolia]